MSCPLFLRLCFIDKYIVPVILVYSVPNFLVLTIKIVVLFIFCSCYNRPVRPIAYHTISFLTKRFIEHSSCSISQSFPSYRYLLPLSSSRLASAPSSFSIFLSLAPAVQHLLVSHATIHLRMYYYRLWGVNALRSRRPRAQLPFFKKVKQMFASRRGSPSSTPAASPSSYKYAAFSNPLHYTFHRIRHTRV